MEDTEFQDKLEEYLLEVGALSPGVARIARNRERAKELQNAKTSGLRNTGRFMQAPHPLEHIATFLSQAAGRRKEQEAEAAEDEIQRKRREALDRLRQRPPKPQAQPFPTGADGMIEDPYGVAGTSF
jgi:hypothetical protein